MATSVFDNRNKAVVAFLDGRRLKGYIYNFSPQEDCFRLFSHPDHGGQREGQQEGTDVQMKDLKAIFFAKDSGADREYPESQTLSSQNQGRKAEVTFRDGEKLVGTTDACHPQKVGFFLVPADPRSNNLRVFVIARNATKIIWI